jgi:NO-binding membrane sensor protein with MHYT domain/signal transduction histidine kinase/CheY-like chemotaxis protein
MIMAGTHDALLVALSILIAVIASYSALDLSSRVRASRGRVRLMWLYIASVAMGGGIWSMHFVAMLAFKMPGMAVGYDIGPTIASLLLAIVFTGIGFGVMSRARGSIGWLVLAGVLMGCGVVAMHYVGMAAMHMAATLSYRRLWVALSVLIAIGAATSALWLASRERAVAWRIAAAGAMGLAIAGMHYVGMRAAVFTMDPHIDMATGAASVGQASLAWAVTGLTILILLLVLSAAWVDRRVAEMRRREARTTLRLQLADVMRDATTDDALHRAAAAMGRHFGVSRVGYGQLDPIEDMFDYNICWTDGTVPPLLGRYPARAFGLKIVAALNAGETVVVDDLAVAAISDEAETRATASEVDTRAILVVPFLRAGRLRTILYLNSRLPRHWATEEVRFMEEVAERTRQVIARAEVETQLRDLNGTLEARIEERTGELRQAEAALRQSQKMEAIGQLTGGIAHDFNNMLMGITGALEIMKRRIADGRVGDLDRFMDAATTSAQRAAGLTARLLAFSRRQSLDSRPVDVNALVRSLEELLGRTMSGQIRVEIATDNAIPPALVDANQLESAILNLAINARDAMPDGGVLRVGTRLAVLDEAVDALPDLLRAGRFVVVEVADSGVGMARAVLDKVFDPFFTTKPIGKGTGLGLSMVYGFARQSNGQIAIESASGEGTAVRLYLPVAETEAAAIEGGGEVQPVPVAGKGQAVLLVEDDESVRLLVRNALLDLGYDPVEAPDAQRALEILVAGRRFELLVTDVGLPGMNGRQLAEAARQHLPDLPVLFMTGYAEGAGLRSEFLGPGMDLMVKPFQLDALAIRLGALLG